MSLEHDPLNCSHVGWPKTRGAIEISHRYGEYEMATSTYDDEADLLIAIGLYMLNRGCNVPV